MIDIREKSRNFAAYYLDINGFAPQKCLPVVRLFLCPEIKEIT